MKEENFFSKSNQKRHFLKKESIQTPQTCSSLMTFGQFQSMKQLSFSQVSLEANQYFLQEDPQLFQFDSIKEVKQSKHEKQLFSDENAQQQNCLQQQYELKFQIILSYSIDKNEHKIFSNKTSKQIISGQKLQKSQQPLWQQFLNIFSSQKERLVTTVTEFQLHQLHKLNQSREQKQNILVHISIKMLISGFQRIIFSFQLPNSQLQFSYLDTQQKFLVNKKSQKLLTISFPYQIITQLKQIQVSLLNKSQMLNQITHLKDLKGLIFQLSQQNMGSRIIQKLIYLHPNESISIILQEQSMRHNILMMDKYGNYIIQKMFYHFPYLQKLQFIQTVKQFIPQISKTKYGTFCLQHILTKCTSNSGIIEVIQKSIQNSIFQIATNQNGTYFLQELMSRSKCSRFTEYFLIQENLLKVSNNKHGVLTLKCLMKKICFFSPSSITTRANFLTTISTIFQQTIIHQYGHFIIQQLTKYYQQFQLNWLLNLTISKLTLFANNQYSSNVINIYLEAFPYVHFYLIFNFQIWTVYLYNNIFCNNNEQITVQLMKSKSGSFIIHRLVEVVDCGSKKVIESVLKKCLKFVNQEERKLKWKNFLYKNNNKRLYYQK